MRTPQLGLLALLGLLTFSCVSPAGTGSSREPRKRAPTPTPAEATSTPRPGATATPVPPGATPAPESTATPANEGFFAEVRSAAGTPVSGATVKAYLPSGLAPIKGATTDSNGRFDLLGLAVWPVNLEVVGPMGDKVYKEGVSADTRELVLVLAAPGQVAGRVTAPSLEAAPDFSDLTVRVFGTSYSAQAATDGAFVFEGLPAGSFELVGQGPLLGEAATVEVAVTSEARVTAPELIVAPTAPKIGALTPNHGGPGRLVTIQGTGFSASSALSVRFGAVAAETAERLSDTEIRAAVPASAANGPVVVTLGGKLPSAGRPFRVLERLTISAATTALEVGQEVAFTVEARDTEDAVVAAPVLSAWRSSDPTIAEVEASGTVRGLAAGQVVLSIGSGALEATSAVTVTSP